MGNETSKKPRRRQKRSVRRRLQANWRGIINRCYNPESKSYRYYGQVGVTVCDEWRHSFEVFLQWALNNGFAWELEIDRIDCLKGYSPDNCRWVTRLVNARNKRYQRLIEAFGESKLMSEWVEDPRCVCGLKTLKSRLVYGHSPEAAITTPIGQLNPIHKKSRATRTNRGEANCTSKLNDEAVRCIRQQYSDGTENQYSLARKYGVTQAAIWYVLHKRTWSHVEETN